MPIKREKAQRLLAEWVIRLGLTDWHISLHENCDPDDMTLEGAGEVVYTAVNKHAVIRIMAKKYHQTPEYYNFEKTLVHELLHIKMGITFDNLHGVEYDLLHQNLEDMARAYISAKYGTERYYSGRQATP
jgi:hypothetical protein